MQILAKKIANFADKLSFRDLPEDVVKQARVRIVDAFACVFGGYDTETCKIVRDVADEQMMTEVKHVDARHYATVLGTDIQTHPTLATFANSAMVRYLDYNDTYLSLEPAHPSDNISACIAVAESESRSGEDLITAIVLAYEIQCRLCDTACLRCRGFDHTTYGVISTAAACAKLFDCDASQIEEAISMATASNISLRQIRVGRLSQWKGCAFGQVAMNGLFAGSLAKRGMTGPSPIFEGDSGFEKEISGSLRGFKFDNSFKLPKTYIKYYPAEYHAQASIEVALQLRKDLDGLADVLAVEIEIYDAAIEIIGDRSKWHPDTKETADHSLPFIVASALLYGDIDINSYAPERLADKKIADLMTKIKLISNEKYTRKYGRSFSNTIRVKLRSGKVLEASKDYARGHPKNPLTQDQIEMKFQKLSQRYFSPTVQRRLLDRLWSIDRENNMHNLMKEFVIK